MLKYKDDVLKYIVVIWGTAVSIALFPIQVHAETEREPHIMTTDITIDVAGIPFPGVLYTNNTTNELLSHLPACDISSFARCT